MGYDERVLSVLALIWGVFLVLPGDAFQSVRSYQLLNRYAPDWVWGLLFLACALTLLVIPFLNSSTVLPKPNSHFPFWQWVMMHPRNILVLRRDVHLVLALVWLFMAFVILLAASSWASRLILNSPVIAVSLLHCGAYLRLDYWVLVGDRE